MDPMSREFSVNATGNAAFRSPRWFNRHPDKIDETARILAPIIHEYAAAQLSIRKIKKSGDYVIAVWSKPGYTPFHVHATSADKAAAARQVAARFQTVAHQLGLERKEEELLVVGDEETLDTELTDAELEAELAEVRAALGEGE